MQRRHSFNFGQIDCAVIEHPRDTVFADIEPPRFIVADTNTARFVPGDESCHILPAGEASKSWEELQSILRAMLEADLTRQSAVVGVGGGVISDIAAFAASLYMRGCKLVLVPTTLLAMVDAALGGKTSVNFGGYKNMVGTFYPATEVRLCPELLHTLPQREYLGGLAEAIKTSMLGDPELLDLIEQNTGAIEKRDDDLLAEIVWRCIMVKGRIVEADLRESHVREHLNLGHTFGHALEVATGLTVWNHGEAVAWGLARAMEAGVAAGITPRPYARRVLDLLAAFGYRTDPQPELSGAMLETMRKDKKRRGESIRFVLQRGPGDTIVAPLEEPKILSVLGGELVKLDG